MRFVHERVVRDHACPQCDYKTGVASNLSSTSVVIPQGGLQLTIEGSDWEARIISGFEKVIASTLQAIIPGLAIHRMHSACPLRG